MRRCLPIAERDLSPTVTTELASRFATIDDITQVSLARRLTGILFAMWRADV